MEKTGFLPVCPFEGEHPEMLIAMPQQDKRFDVQTGCDFTENTQTFD